ncbi:hypothetical protein HYV85_05830 [Candidatus Woesearchaeota archaeon]|nr:hypothetical protein [Candidatus Woesearchaeota archaeon]
MTFSRNVKAQAAMEFLMTYGWAILVVLVVIGALAYFGVLSPSTLLPEKCTFPVSVSCTDHTIGNVYLAVMLQNGAGRDMFIRGMTATSDALGAGNMCTTKVVGGAPVLTDVCPTSNGVIGPGGANTGCFGGPTFRNGETKTIVMNQPGGTCKSTSTGRDKNRYNVTVFYSWLDGQGIMHQLSGELLARRP